MKYSPFHDRILTGPVLCRSCVDNHSFCDFKSIIVHVMPEIQHSTLLPSSPSVLTVFLILGCPVNLEKGDIDVSFMAGQSTVTHSLHTGSCKVSAVPSDQCKKKLLLLKQMQHQSIDTNIVIQKRIWQAYHIHLPKTTTTKKTQQNNSFPTRTFAFSSHRSLIRFIVLGMNFLPWNWHKIQPENIQLLF